MAKKSSGFLKVFLIVIIVLALVTTGGFFGTKYYLAARERKAAIKSEELLMDTVIIDSDNDLTAETLPSSDYDFDYDGDGLTNKEEIDLGTDFFRTDTDGDGLSDFDEVRTHGSDPLKYSTSDDGISDLVKVLKDLDFNRAYTVAELDLQPVELADNLDFLPDDTDSEMLHVYETYSGNLFQDWTCLTPPFVLYEAKGFLTSELTDGFTAQNTAVYYYDPETRSLLKDTSMAVDGSLIKFSCHPGVPVAVVRTDLLPEGIAHAGSLSDDMQKVRTYYMLIVPFSEIDTSNIPDIGVGGLTLSSFVKEKDTVFIIGIDGLEGIRSISGDPELESRIRSLASDWDVDQYFVGQTLFDLVKSVYDSYAASDDLDTKDAISNVFIKKVTCSTSGLSDEVVLFMTENGYTSEVPAGAASLSAHSGFNVSENGFLFSNLSTSLSEGGVCAGFSFLARQGYNNFPLERQKGAYSFSTYSYSGYSASASEYDLIFAGRPGEYELKSAPLKAMSDMLYDSYDQGYLIRAEQMDEPDKSVVDLLNYYWLYNNGERIRYEQSSGVLKTYDYRFSAIEDIYNEFKSGRVVEMGIFGTPGGHAIVGYALRQDPSDPNLFYMSVYDSNFPENKRFVYSAGKVIRAKTEVTMLIRRVPKMIMGSDGIAVRQDFFTFRYQVGTGSYLWSNMNGEGDRVVFYKTGTGTKHSVFVR
ncbi:MAG: hypothetical protein PHN99_06950 [Eubacteriales bacterium]|nr:hypothetical protein [Eubacteriales bacterium]MDD4717837.1 hypothetical protein [Eubacteriales bacterium]